ncbi:MAG: GNAT family N-acetyltransferase [bacterium]
MREETDPPAFDPPTPLRVRRLRPADSVGALTLLIHRAYAPLLEKGLHFVAATQDEATTRSRIAEGECFVAEVDGRIVGTILLRPPTASTRCAYYARAGVASIHQLAVEPALQRRGIARRLVEAAEERAREIGAEEVALDTAESASHLLARYERWGYRVVDAVDWRPEVNYRSVVMAKTLSPGMRRSTDPERAGA